MRRALQDWPYADFSRGQPFERPTPALMPPRLVDARAFAELVHAVRCEKDRPGFLRSEAAVDAVDVLISGMRGDLNGAALSRLKTIPGARRALERGLATGAHTTEPGLRQLLSTLGRGALDSALDEAPGRLLDQAFALEVTRLCGVMERDRCMGQPLAVAVKRATAQLIDDVNASLSSLARSIDVALHGTATHRGSIAIESDDEVITVDTVHYRTVTEILGDELDAPANAATLAMFMRSRPGPGLKVPTELKAAFDAFLLVRGVEPSDPKAVGKFLGYAQKRAGYRARTAGKKPLSTEQDRRFRATLRASTGGRRSAVSGPLGGELVEDSTRPVAPNRPVRRRGPPSDAAAEWIRGDDVFNSARGAGAEAFWRAAKAVGFEDRVVQMVMGEKPTWALVHLDTKKSVTPDSLEAAAGVGKDARYVGEQIRMLYQLSEADGKRLRLAKRTVTGGYPTIKAYEEDEAGRARQASFEKTGKIPGAEAAFQGVNWLGIKIAEALRSETGQQIVGTIADPIGLIARTTGTDIGGAVGRGGSDATLTLTQIASNAGRLAHLFFITKPMSFARGYNGPMPDGWAKSATGGAARDSTRIDTERKKYDQVEKTVIGQTIRVVTASIPDLVVLSAAAAAPPILIYWNIGKYGHKSFNAVVDGFALDVLGTMLGPVASRVLKAVPVANALRPGGFETLAKYVATNEKSVVRYLATVGADTLDTAASGLADEKWREAARAIYNGTATQEQKRIVVAPLLAKGIQKVASSVLSPKVDADELSAFSRPEAQRPLLAPDSSVYRTTRDGKVQYSGVVILPNKTFSYSLLDPNTPQIKNAIGRRRIVDTDPQSVDAALFTSRLERVSPADQKKAVSGGVDDVIREIDEIGRQDGASRAEVNGSSEAQRAAQVAMAPWVARDVRSTLQRAVDRGPNRWTATGNAPEGARFQRGMSGGYGDGLGGLGEAKRMLAGKTDRARRTVSLINEKTKPGETTRDVTALYADPLSVRGRSNKLDVDQGRDASREAVLENMSFKDVEAIGFFLPTNGRWQWSQKYLKLLDETGAKPTPGSKGAKFVVELREVLATAKWEEDSIGRSLANESDLEAGLQRVFTRYGAREQ